MVIFHSYLTYMLVVVAAQHLRRSSPHRKINRRFLGKVTLNHGNSNRIRSRRFILAIAALSMYLYIYIYIHTYKHTYMHACMHAYIHAYIHTQTHTYIHTYIRTYVRTYIHTYLQTHTHTYIHTYIRTYVHTYIHTCIEPGLTQSFRVRTALMSVFASTFS